jgi:hypothetical protein
MGSEISGDPNAQAIASNYDFMNDNLNGQKS